MQLSLWLAAADQDEIQSRVNEIANTHDQIVLALIGVVATAMAALVFVIRNGRYGKTAAEQATAANKAVNNVGPGHDNLYRMVESIREDVDVLMTNKNGWDHLPSDLHDAVAVTQTIRNMQQADKVQEALLQSILAELRQHVEWEMNEKYGTHGSSLP